MLKKTNPKIESGKFESGSKRDKERITTLKYFKNLVNEVILSSTNVELSYNKAHKSKIAMMKETTTSKNKINIIVKVNGHI